MSRWLLMLVLLIVGCQPPLGQQSVGKGGATLRVQLMRALKTQAIASDVDHVTVKLYEQTGPTLVDTVTTTDSQAAFTGVTDGTYYVTAEAFSSADDSVSITNGGPATSSNTATVTGGAASYSSGTAFDLILQLDDEAGQSVEVAVTGPAGTAYPSALVSLAGAVLTTYNAASSPFHFISLDSGNYSAWSAIQLSATASTIARKATNTATVAGRSLAYSSGSALNVSITGNIHSLEPSPPYVAREAQIEGDQGDVAFAPGGGAFYYVEYENHRCRKVDLATGRVATVAGTGVSGFAVDGGLATSAQLAGPKGVAVDVDGNLYIADLGNHRIRKVNALTGVITTVAGSGAMGFMGDGGGATAARLLFPSGVTVDAAGNIYIADTGNHRVRKVDAVTGNIGTIAGNGAGAYAGDGGLATAASIKSPYRVRLDGAGNLYIADTGNHCIRKVDTLGNISTVAGTGASGYSGDGGQGNLAKLNNPVGLSVDSAGNVLIGDANNSRIRRVTVATGVITTIMGNGAAVSSGDGGLASAARTRTPVGLCHDAANNLLVYEANRVRLIASATGIVDTVAGFGARGSSYLFNSPYAVATDAAGNVYVADSSNNLVRKMDTGGVFSVVAGTGTAGFSGDNGLATAATLISPKGVAVDSAGHLYVADSQNNRIRRVDAVTGVITTVAGTGGNAYAGDGGLATAAQLNGPQGIAFDGAGNLYVADSGNACIRKVAAADGRISTVAGTGAAGFGGDGGLAIAAQLSTPADLVFSQQGDLIISDTGNRRIRRVDALTGVISTITGNGTNANAGDGGPAALATISAPFGIDLDGIGNLYVVASGACRVRKIDALTGNITTVAGTGSNIYNGDERTATSANLWAIGLEVDDMGNLYIADNGNNRVRKLD